MYKKTNTYFVILFAFILYVVYTGFQNHSVSSVSKQLPKEYLEMLPKKSHGLLSSVYTFTVEGKPPVTRAVFDSLYIIVFCKLELENSQTLLLEEILTKKEYQNITDQIISGPVVMSNLYQLTYNIDKPIGNREIIISSNDFLNNIYKSDSALSYFTISNNLSLSYNNEKNQDLFLKTRGHQILEINKIPMSLLFIRKKESVYLVLMSTNSVDDEFPQDIILKTFGLLP